jgi:predicted sulfurtransferase
VFLL